MISAKRLFQRLRGNCDAVAMTEFALATPLLLTVGLYGLEMGNLAITHMQISQTAMHLADNASRIGDTSTLQDRKIYEADLNDLLLGADHQAGDSIDIYEHGRVIISSLETDPDDTTGVQQWIHWQRCKGKRNHASSYGEAGDGKGDPTFVGMGPAGEEVIALQDEAVIFVEVAYEYQPVVTDAFISDRIITATASFNVRDHRDLSQIYYADPADPEPISACTDFDSFKVTPTLEKSNPGGWKWFTDTSSSGGSSSTTTSGGSTTTTTGGTTTTTGGSTTTTSGGTTTTSGGTTTTSGGTTTTSGGTTTTSGGGGGSGGASSSGGGKPPK